MNKNKDSQHSLLQWGEEDDELLSFGCRSERFYLGDDEPVIRKRMNGINRYRTPLPTAQ
ncbi:MAG TPA: hypothetical protein PLD69_06295 [Sphaerochaeta sp.]|jgi:hypothetical protein|nr:hypothetical protein [Sphaerochaeta sp.]HQB05533.1 hypothetical protein [Sphaerochaeta sp.]